MASNPLEPLPYRLVLGSGSPRRKEILSQLNVPFEIRVIPIDEQMDFTLPPHRVAEDLAVRKANAHQLMSEELLITADTVVHLDGHFLDKPRDRSEAISGLMRLQGRDHDVYTGVALTTTAEQRVLHGHTRVYFREMKEEEVAYYVDRDQPFDKAGGYGAQDWLGYTGVSRLDGTFYNVMGLPIDLVYQELLTFIS